jgi:hypothetical protein
MKKITLCSGARVCDCVCVCVYVYVYVFVTVYVYVYVYVYGPAAFLTSALGLYQCGGCQMLFNNKNVLRAQSMV